jgi:hypothetical protein
VTLPYTTASSLINSISVAVSSATGSSVTLAP